MGHYEPDDRSPGDPAFIVFAASFTTLGMTSANRRIRQLECDVPGMTDHLRADLA